MKSPYWSSPWLNRVSKITVGPLEPIANDGGMFRRITFENAHGSIDLTVHADDSDQIEVVVEWFKFTE